jgi:hypothetical protein
MIWYKHGKRHRVNDKPALVKPDGTLVWYLDGFIHRGDDKPALIAADGKSMEWYRVGMCYKYTDLCVHYY